MWGVLWIDGTLTPHSRVACGNGGCQSQGQRHVAGNDAACADHGKVGERVCRTLHIGAIPVHLCMAHQHTSAWNPHILEAKETIVHTNEAHFLANLSDVHARTRLMGALLSHLHVEHVRPLGLAIDIKLRHHQAVVGRVTHCKKRERLI